MIQRIQAAEVAVEPINDIGAPGHWTVVNDDDGKVIFEGYALLLSHPLEEVAVVKARARRNRKTGARIIRIFKGPNVLRQMHINGFGKVSPAHNC